MAARATGTLARFVSGSATDPFHGSRFLTDRRCKTLGDVFTEEMVSLARHRFGDRMQNDLLYTQAPVFGVCLLGFRGCLKSSPSEDYRGGMPESINSGKCYETDLNEAAWRLIEPMLPAARPGGRPRTTNLRSVLNAIFYLLRTGCQWRLLPREFPAWSTVYHYFRSWNNGGVWSSMQRLICQQARG